MGVVREGLTKHNKPLRLLDTVLIGLRIPECLPVNFGGFLDLLTGTVTDEDGLATPFDDDLFDMISVCKLFRGVVRRTFLPSGMEPRAISTLAWARTSAEADILTRKSVYNHVSSCRPDIGQIQVASHCSQWQHNDHQFQNPSIDK